MLRLFFILSFISVVFLNVADGVAQSTLIVTNTNDSGDGSLRQAILDAGAGDVIAFEDSLLNQVIVLSSGALLIDKDLTVTGPGRPVIDTAIYLEISASDSSRVLEIQPDITVTLSDLVVRNGYTETDGGGMWIGEGANVILERVALEDNHALDNGGAIYNSAGANLLIQSGLIADNKALGDLSPNGGGLYNAAGSVRIEGGTVTGNESVRGGGIWNTSNGRVQLFGVLVQNNEASAEGGGIYNNHKMIIHSSTIAENEAQGEAGGIRNRSGDSLLIVNSTISSNRAPQTGGIHNFRASNVYIYNSTIVFNESDEDGAGLFNEEDAAITLYSSIIAANVRDGSVVSDVLDQSGGKVTSEGFNFIGVRGALNVLSTDQSGTSSAPFNPQLEPLMTNGSSSYVHFPREISLTIDQGECAKMPLFLDQSGFLRIIDIAGVDNASDGCDVGSVEFGSAINVSQEDSKAVPGRNRLSHAYPNPFTLETTFHVEVENDQEIQVDLYDMLGKKVMVIYEGFVQGGMIHRFEIEKTEHLSSGMYIYQVKGPSIYQSRQVVLRR